ncbi:hypothetical protein XENOCAPTIV_005331 [Xenoophorus captivus]|uniref:Uncharacterized protein n=1 Tax=Xenoophorus captivus TaxID=1517983 RepID=A0ABV0S633_9TELE
MIGPHPIASWFCLRGRMFDVLYGLRTQIHVVVARRSCFHLGSRAPPLQTETERFYFTAEISSGFPHFPTSHTLAAKQLNDFPNLSGLQQLVKSNDDEQPQAGQEDVDDESERPASHRFCWDERVLKGCLSAGRNQGAELEGCEVLDVELVILTETNRTMLDQKVLLSAERFGVFVPVGNGTKHPETPQQSSPVLCW